VPDFLDVDGQQLVPPGRIRRRLKLPPHIPALAEQLAGGTDGAVAIAAVDLVYGCRQFRRLAGVVPVITEQRPLRHPGGQQVGQQHARPLVTEPRLMDALQAQMGGLDKAGGIICRPVKNGGGAVAVLG